MKRMLIYTCLLLLLGTYGFIIVRSESGEIEPIKLDIPQGFPYPSIPENNVLTADRIKLGRMLFYDPVLSSDSTVSCASCHQPSKAFADNRVISPGVKGRLADRNAPTLTNVAYNPVVMFDGFLKDLERQVLVPIQEHAEFASNIVVISEKLSKDSIYSALSWKAYNRKIDPFVITRSIASFERTLISGNSDYDKYTFQGQDVLSRSAKRGMKLFFEELKCVKCHAGFNFTDFSVQNNGLYENYKDIGRQRATHLESDNAKFKVPTLRNIALTAPYMHDGSLATLSEVIDHYSTGGKNHPNKSAELQAFDLNKRQKKDVIRFLESLTDTSFTNNPAFSNPFNK
jgi:cytochrome c peroxidase